MMTKILRSPVRVVFYRDDDDRSVWIAHCLEFDLIGDGSTKQEAFKMLARAISIQVEQSFRSGNPMNLFTPAPPEYQVKYARGRDTADGEFEIVLEDEAGDLEIEGTAAREYDDGYAECGERNLALA